MPIQIGSEALADFTDPIAMLHDCHRRIERFLDVLLVLSRERRGVELYEPGRTALAAALHYFDVGAPLHTEDEESSLFPRLRSARLEEEAAHLGERLLGLENEHRSKELAHRTVHRLGTTWLHEGRLGLEDARILLTELECLECTYRRHMRREEDEVFPLAARVLCKEDLLEIASEMKTRRRLSAEQTG